MAAALVLLEKEGARGVSARNLAKEAQVGVSAMNYSFGGRQALVDAAFQVATDRALEWWRQAGERLPEGLAPAGGWLSATLVEARRDRAFPRLAISELFQTAPRSEAMREVAAAYQGEIEGFWRGAAARFGLRPEAGEVLGDYAAGAMASPAWSGLATLDMPWSVDSCQRLLARLAGGRVGLPGWAGWSELKLQQAQEAPPAARPPASDAAERMLAASIELIADAGLEALTHRAVAARSGCTLANVAYHFPTHETLVERTFADVFHGVLAVGAVEEEQLHSRSADAQTLARDTVGVVLQADGRPTPFFMVVRALMLEAERHASLRRLASGLMVEAEASSYRSLHAIGGQGEYDRLDAHLAVLANGGAIQATLAAGQGERAGRLARRVAAQVQALFIA